MGRHKVGDLPAIFTVGLKPLGVLRISGLTLVGHRAVSVNGERQKSERLTKSVVASEVKSREGDEEEGDKEKGDEEEGGSVSKGAETKACRSYTRVRGHVAKRRGMVSVEYWWKTGRLVGSAK